MKNGQTCGWAPFTASLSFMCRTLCGKRNILGSFLWKKELKQGKWDGELKREKEPQSVFVVFLQMGTWEE